MTNALKKHRSIIRGYNKKKNQKTSESRDIYVVDWYPHDVEAEKEDDEESEKSESSSEYNRKPNVCNKKFMIQAFGLDDDNNSVAINIENFKPYFFIKIPTKWTKNIISLFIDELKSRVWKSHSETLIDHQVVHAKPFYYFTGNDKYKYLKLVFSCLEGFNRFNWLLKEPLKIPGLHRGRPFTYERYESNIPPLLRFIHSKNLYATGWLRLPSNQYESNTVVRNTECQCEYTVNHNYIVALKEKESIPKMEYVAYDIEADSSHGDFPIAKKNYQKLARDIITMYNHYSNQKVPNDKIKKYISRGLELAFNDYFNNNNIRNVFTKSGEKPDEELIEQAATEILAIVTPLLVERSDNIREQQMELLDLFEENFPELDEDADTDYFSLSEQIILAMQDLHAKNNVIFKKHPERVVQLLLELAFDENYDNPDINVVYTKDNSKPEPMILECIVPLIIKVCEKCYAFTKTKKKRQKAKEGEAKITQDTFVDELTAIFDNYFPPVEGDIVIQIGSTFKRYGEQDCFLKHIICLDTCADINNETLIRHENKDLVIPKKDLAKEYGKLHPEMSGDDIKGFLKNDDNYKKANAEAIEARYQQQLKTDTSAVIVETYKTEEEVLLAWQRLIAVTDPDIIIGYNIFGFDFKFMYERAVELGIDEEFMMLGRMTEEVQELKSKDLKSSGLGDNSLDYIEMFGRVIIDLYKVAQASFKLESYKLDYICKKYLNKSKDDVPPSEIFVKQKGNNEDRKKIAVYCLIDCILCNRFLDKLEILVNNIGMSQVCSVPFSFLFMRGQSIKLLSFVAKICREKGYLIKVLPKLEEAEESYEGAIVLPPTKGIFDDPVVVNDFNSLYPSCIISENLSHDSYVSWKVVDKGERTNYHGELLNPDNRYEVALLEGAYEGWYYNDVVFDLYEEVPVAKGRKKTKKIVVGHKICRFAQPPEGKSIVPTILMDLLSARKATKKDRDNYPKGSFKYNIREALQLAYKVTANSLYGQMGAIISAIYCQDIAACTTSTGRNLIMISKNFVLTNYANSEIVYGDTDSIFSKFACKDRYGNKLYGLDAIYKSIELSIEAGLGISRGLKPPHNLEFEKAIRKFVLISKKRYHGHYYTKYGDPGWYPNSMGIVLKRRDNAPIVKHVFGGMMDIIMMGSIEKAIEFVIEECKKVLNGEFDIKNFIVTKTLRSYYKNPMQIAHNVLAQRIGKRDPGNKPRGNDRIPYVYVMKPTPDCLQGDRIETPQFVEEHKLKIDYRFYITNQIAKPVTQIFALVMDDADKIFDQILMEYDHKAEGLTKITDEKYSEVIQKLHFSAAAISKEINRTSKFKEEYDDSDEDEGNESDDDIVLEL